MADEAKGIYCKTDVSVEDNVKDLMESTVSKFGKIDIIVNDAGIGGQEGFIQDITNDGIDEALNVNLKGNLWGIKHGGRLILDGGSIINTASYSGLFGTPTYGVYVASKFAVVGMTRTAALELAPRGVRVNCICPGTVDTPMACVEGAEIELKLSSLLMPLGRLATSDEVAALFHFLASDESAFITGAAIPIDGGMSAGPGLNMIEALYQVVTGEQLNLAGEPK